MARRLLKGTRPRHCGPGVQVKMIKNMTRSSLVVLVIGSFSQVALALENPAAGLLDQVQSMNRLRKSYDAILKTPSVRRLKRADSAHDFVISQRVKTLGVETTKYQHYYKGLEVVGSVAFHHSSNKEEKVQDAVVAFELDTKPTLPESEAAAIAQSLNGNLALSEIPLLQIIPSKKDKSARLIYSVKIKGNAVTAAHTVTLDAHSGIVLSNISDEISIAPIDIYQGDQNNILVNPQTAISMPQGADSACQVINSITGAPLVIHRENCDQTVKNSQISGSADASAKRAFSNSEKTLSYFLDVHGRHGYDDQDSPTISIVHAGKAFVNAFWNMNDDIMAYGDGDGIHYGDFTQGVDVAGHELTHGVTSHTAHLDYKGESGALNEANSDFFGKMIANDGTWALGKTLNLNPNAPALRDLANPGSIMTRFKDENGNARPYPSRLSEKFELPEGTACDRTNDNCFVHTNATITGHARYLVTQAIGKDLAQKLYYFILLHRLSSSSDIVEEGKQAIDACSSLDGMSPENCTKVVGAYAQVGITNQ